MAWKFPFRYIRTIEHFQKNHPNNETIKEIITGVRIHATCKNCDGDFIAEVAWNNGIMSHDAYCEECINDDPIREVYATKVGAEEVLENQTELGKLQNGSK
jgi:hypothetical protein